MPNSINQFQSEIAASLKLLFPQPLAEVQKEWRAITNITGIYSPRIDIAVGPFSIIRGENCIKAYDGLLRQSEHLITCLIENHCSNVKKYRHTDDSRIKDALRLPTIQRLMDHNRNARCFLAIEIENEVSRKHLLGGAVNASALGRIGLVVGWTENKVEALIRLQAYWDFLASVGKNTYRTDNLLIVSPEQLRNALNSCIKQS
jgi:hypothetical protein